MTINGYESPAEYLPSKRQRHGFSSSDARVGDDGARNMDNVKPLKEKKEEASVRRKAQIRKVSIRDRIQCFTWTWFLMTMATGGIANVLHSIPFRSNWLQNLGVTFCLFNIALFIFNCTMISIRFANSPGSFRSSFTHQSESLFIPACIVSTGVILTNICQYGVPKSGPWLQSTMEIFFWLYAGASMLGSAGMYLILWSTQTFPIQNMTPIWIFPAYPLLLSAPFASNLIDALPLEGSNVHMLAIALGAVTLQGTGFLVSLMMYGAFIYRLMSQKLPREHLRPGMFVSVGPAGFTAAGLVHLGNVLIPKVLPTGWQGNHDLALMLKLLSNFVGFWLWGLCIWFFLVSLGAHWNFFSSPYTSSDLSHTTKHHPRAFEMTFFSFVFPNTALVTATQALGKALSSRPLQIVGTVFAVILVLVWGIVFGAGVRAVIKQSLLWPEDAEDDSGDREIQKRGERGIRGSDSGVKELGVIKNGNAADLR